MAVLTVLANLIVLGTFVGAFEGFIRLVDVLEFTLGVLLFADIRVILARQLAISGLDRLIVGCGVYTQNLVIVFEVHVRITIRYQYRATQTTHNAWVGQSVD